MGYALIIIYKKEVKYDVYVFWTQGYTAFC